MIRKPGRWLPLCALFWAATALAADWPVRVRMGAYAVPHAIVSARGVPVAVADEAGLAALPAGMLRRGDTLVACLPGTCPVPLRYEAALLGDTALLEVRDTLGLGAPTLCGRSAALLGEGLAPARAADVNGVLEGRFRFEEFPSGRVFEGRFAVQNEVSGGGVAYFREKGWFHHPVEWVADSARRDDRVRRRADSPEASPAAAELAIHEALDLLNSALSSIQPGPRTLANVPVYEAWPADTSGLLFRFTLPMMRTRSMQMLVRTASDGLPRRVVIAAFDRTHRRIERMEADVDALAVRRPLRATLLLPARVEYGYRTPYRSVRLTLGDLHFLPQAAQR